MKFTVAICTWNGANRIGQTLDSFIEMEQIDQIDWELVVVDNNSTDNTIEICKSYADRLPVRVCSETKQGHSNSRNRAIDESNGKFIVWTDDDVLVDPDWLYVYDLAVDAYPEFDFFGGKITPYFEHDVPKWVHQNWEICSGLFAERDQGDGKFEILKPEQLPYGANFVTRQSVQKAFRFDPKFGRVAKGVRGFDEIDVLSRMLEAGHRGMWIPESRLQHLIPESRTTLKYLADFYEGQGETWIERGVSKLTRPELLAQIRKKEVSYCLSRIMFSRTLIPILAELSNLRGQLAAVSR